MGREELQPNTNRWHGGDFRAWQPREHLFQWNRKCFPRDGIGKAPSLWLIVMHVYYPSFSLKLGLVLSYFFPHRKQISFLCVAVESPRCSCASSHNKLACLSLLSCWCWWSFDIVYCVTHREEQGKKNCFVSLCHHQWTSLRRHFDGIFLSASLLGSCQSVDENVKISFHGVCELPAVAHLSVKTWGQSGRNEGCCLFC